MYVLKPTTPHIYDYIFFQYLLCHQIRTKKVKHTECFKDGSSFKALVFSNWSTFWKHPVYLEVQNLLLPA